jgi:diguanylate cyclase (GGDEF)-like protein
MSDLLPSRDLGFESDRMIVDMWERPSSLVAATLDSVKEGILVFDDQLQLVHMSDKLSQMLDIPGDSLAGESSLASIVRAGAIGPDSVETALQRAAAAVAGGADANAPAILTTRDGSRIFSLDIRRIADRYWTAAFEDITADRAANARVMELALRDPLTGLGNRLFFEQRCSAFVRQRARIAMLLLDLDRFKAVNDTLGHPIGDTLLKLVAERLQGCLRTYDITARLGGDEFAVLLDRAVEQVDPAEIGRRLIDIIGRPYLIDGNIVHVGASIGVALAPADGAEYGELLRKADLALYDAKANGRNMVCFFDNAMEERAKDRRAIEQDIRKALRLREFELHYQPQVDIDTQRLLGFEALLYWRHPARGLMKAMQFARLAEELNLIGKIGEWMLHSACREAARWPQEITVSVSASPSQFAASGFTAFVARALQAAGLKGHRLVIQVSETVLSRSESQVIATLQELRAMDVRVAMDEFGTGYASLSQIARFPLDSIKIDKSLLGESVNSARHRAIVRAITALGAGLGISTLADGVETPDQLKTIRSDGCAPLQGYLRSQPIPPAEMDTVIASLSSKAALPFVLPSLPIAANLPTTKGGS